MRKALVAVAVCVACSSSGRQSAVQQAPSVSPTTPPPWAYGFAAAANSAGAAPAPGGGSNRPPGGGGGGGGGQPDTTKHTVPGSTLSFTLAQVRNTSGPADWFPGDHPEMPPIVAGGRREANILACSLCHYPNGKGRPENAGVSGLPVTYFVQTMNDFRNDLRKSSDARKANTNRMIAFAKAMTDEEIKAAAEYFAKVKWTPWVRVVEADVVPKTRIAGGMFIPIEGAEAGTEPIGQRIIEVPEDARQTEVLRNPRSGFVAYVPKGSIARGQAIATRGQCALCHGSTLQGLGPVPGIAGRSPSYVVRQLYDIQAGARKGTWSELMKAAVAPMTADDMIAVASYVASRSP
jgi:cytochrome c553